MYSRHNDRQRLSGFIFAAIAAASYGTNPAFAVPLYGEGMDSLSVLLFRYGLCIPILALMIVCRKKRFRLHHTEIIPMAILGILMALSSLTLFEAYNYMNSGIASTLLFIYPILVALIMTFAFNEKFKASTALCLIIMSLGLILLLRTGEHTSVSLIGILLVFVSSLTYALYLVMTNVSTTIQKIPTLTLLLWQFLIGGVFFSIVMLVIGQSLTLPAHSWGWISLAALALLPSVISLGFTTEAIHRIGSTSTAIFGALEPLTAVILSVIVLGQTMTTREIVGGFLIMLATTMVIVSDPIDQILLRMRKLFPKTPSLNN